MTKKRGNQKWRGQVSY